MENLQYYFADEIEDDVDEIEEGDPVSQDEIEELDDEDEDEDEDF
jgi:hypothetical protein